MATISGADTSRNDEVDPLLGPSHMVAKQHQAQMNSSRRVLITLLTLATLKTLALQIFGHAQVRIFESIYCKQWYQEHPYLTDSLPFRRGIDEHLCKIAGIQKEVSTLRGYIEWWDAIPGLFLAIPVGVLVDQIGRAWLFRWSVLIILLKTLWTAFVCAVELPLERIYLGSILNLFCGGHMSYEMIFFCILADITPEHKLPNIFFINNALAQSCKVIGPAITGIVIRFDPWYSFVAIIPLLLVSTILAFAVPETLPPRTHPAFRESNPSGVRGGRNFKIFLSAYFKALQDVISTWNDWRLLLLLGLVPLRVMTNALEELLQRYVSYRYGWTLGDAAFLHSLQAIIAAFVLFFVLPRISTVMNQRHVDGIGKNKMLLQSSFGMLAIAFLVQGIAPTVQLLILGLGIETLGSGVPATIRALASVLSGHDNVGCVFSGLATADALSIMAAFPLTAALYNVGVDRGGGIWLGLPFWSTALIMALITIVFCCLPFERSATRISSPEDLQEM